MKQKLILSLVLCAMLAGCKTESSNSTTNNASRSNVSPSGQNTAATSTQTTVSTTEGGLQNKLVGKWSNRYAPIGWEFKSDNSVDVISRQESGELKVIDTGSYRVIDSDTIEITYAGNVGKPPETERLQFEFNKDSMVMILPDKSKRVFNKGL